MKSKKIALSPIDLVVAVVIILLALVFIVATNMKKTQTGKPVFLTVEVADSTQSELIYPEALKLGDVYLNSVNVPVKTSEVTKNGNRLEIKLLGQGEVSNGRYIFNGARILIGQKAEIHAGYFAQGYIKDVKEAK